MAKLAEVKEDNIRERKIQQSTVNQGIARRGEHITSKCKVT